jgi:hypothetical protein
VLVPVLTRSQDNGVLRSWWFIRKQPAWKLRYFPGSAAEQVVPVLERLIAQQQILSWTINIYEPETAACCSAANVPGRKMRTYTREITAHRCSACPTRLVIQHEPLLSTYLTQAP